MKTSEAILCIIKQEGGVIGTLAFAEMLKQLVEAGYLETDFLAVPVLKLTEKAEKRIRERGLKL